AEVLSAFLDNHTIAMGRLRSAVDEGDAKRLHAAAHGLKGGASAIMAERVRAIAERLEDLGHRGEVGLAAAAMAELDLEIGRLQEMAPTISFQGISNHE